MKYSKIKYMELADFRNIKSARISFEDSPIISLVGENESGKTSIVKAFAVASLNAGIRKQKNYIRDGASQFGVEIGLEDGSIIQRVKGLNANALYIKKANGEVIASNKIDSGEVPSELKELMGLQIENETKEIMNIRTYEDQLLFVVTSGGTNYKVMYDALKVEQLSKAIKKGTDETNSLKRSIDESYRLNNNLMDNIRSIRVVDTEPLVKIKERLRESLGKLKKLEQAVTIKSEIEELKKVAGGIENISKLNEIDLNKVYMIDRIRELRDGIDSAIKDNKQYELNKAKEINIELAVKLDNIKGLIEDNKSIPKSKYMGNLNGMKEISESLAYKLIRAKEYKDLLSNMSEVAVVNGNEIKEESILKINTIERAIGFKNNAIKYINEYNRYEGIIKDLEQKLAESGAMVRDCPNCGHTIVMTKEAMY